MSELTNVTITSDASFSAKYGISAWAAYIRTPDKKVQTGALIKEGEARHIFDAERMGIANALTILDKLVDLKDCRLIVYCDNKYALKPSKLNVGVKSKYYEKKKRNYELYAEYIQPYLDKAGEYVLRHVPAHTERKDWSTTSARNYMNDWCDKKARRLVYDEKIRRGLISGDKPFR